MARGTKASPIGQIHIVVGVESHFVARCIPSLLKHMMETPVLGIDSVGEGAALEVGGHIGCAAIAYVRFFDASICSCHIFARGT